MLQSNIGSVAVMWIKASVYYRVKFNYISGSKVLALPGGAVPSNHHIIELVDEIKPKIRELIDNANKVYYFQTQFTLILLKYYFKLNHSPK